MYSCVVGIAMTRVKYNNTRMLYEPFENSGERTHSALNGATYGRIIIGSPSSIVERYTYTGLL